MRHLSAALYCEGPSDARFLGPMIRRLCEDAATHAHEVVEVPDTLVLDDAPAARQLPRAERVGLAAREALGAWTLLFIHADADDREPAAARSDRVDPGIERLTDLLGPSRQALAVIPIRATEAWMLVDMDAVRAATGTTLGDAELGMGDARRRSLERVRNPKGLLQQVWAAAAPRSRPAQWAAYTARLGETVALARLRELSAFRQLESDLHRAMTLMRILP